LHAPSAVTSESSVNADGAILLDANASSFAFQFFPKNEFREGIRACLFASKWIDVTRVCFGESLVFELDLTQLTPRYRSSPVFEGLRGATVSLQYGDFGQFRFV
jgi:hypothetical protein